MSTSSFQKLTVKNFGTGRNEGPRNVFGILLALETGRQIVEGQRAGYQAGETNYIARASICIKSA